MNKTVNERDAYCDAISICPHERDVCVLGMTYLGLKMETLAHSAMRVGTVYRSIENPKAPQQYCYYWN